MCHWHIDHLHHCHSRINHQHHCYGVEDTDLKETLTGPPKCPEPEDGGNVMDKDTGECQARQPVRSDIFTPANMHRSW